MGCEANDVVKTKLDLASKGTESPALQPCIPLRPCKVPWLGSTSHKARAEGPPLPTAAAPKAGNSHLCVTCSDQLHRR